jgi:hypothetical protein
MEISANDIIYKFSTAYEGIVMEKNTWSPIVSEWEWAKPAPGVRIIPIAGTDIYPVLSMTQALMKVFDPRSFNAVITESDNLLTPAGFDQLWERVRPDTIIAPDDRPVKIKYVENVSVTKADQIHTPALVMTARKPVPTSSYKLSWFFVVFKAPYKMTQGYSVSGFMIPRDSCRVEEV